MAVARSLPLAMADAKGDAVGGLAIPGIEILMSGWLHKQGQVLS